MKIIKVEKTYTKTDYELVGVCCEYMNTAISNGVIYRYFVEGMIRINIYADEDIRNDPRVKLRYIKFCPWCGEEIENDM
ncbi:MAG: hypothetical protein R3321_00480 [Nitrososphaeraceae archaeon]|nr:hypothetical protein [Nitrososphaeraceae archaeon]